MGEAMTNRAQPVLASFEEFIAWLDEDTHAEWVAGEVVAMSPVSMEHQHITRFLLRLLAEWLERHGQGEVFAETFQMRLPEGAVSRAPDLLVVTTAHLERLKKTYLDGPADVVIEVMSPESRGRDRGDKYYEYEHAGVPEYWLIDPQRRQAEFYVLDQAGVYQLAEVAEGVFRSVAVAGIWIEVAWLWERPKLLSVLRAWGMLA